ncbi:hypothetical protein QLQ12_24900 [Actinoplanes sp. NEAU-A12]|uniref:Bacterial Pleckstrin homology domain-containing protein n=1 Tax=Actinoplanes sandaracinus TaxID=3045177 RepID=A0ABT6WQA9_9ACTN|nr:hypothetical protein [Actinoplanes sandaracinus]MDI6101864.1 hypothetical protein [Actinoplanes sandaracinus]
MTAVHLLADHVQVRLSLAEKIGGLCGDFDIPRAAVRAADVVPHALSATAGLRAPGLAIPGRFKVGTWRGRNARRFVAVRRDRPALRLTLHGHRYDTVLVSTPDAAALAAALCPAGTRPTAP